MGVLVLLEMDGSTEAVLAAAVDLEARRPTSAKLAQVVAPTESGVVVATFWESAEARDAYQSEPEHREALQASGLLDSVTEMRSRVFEDAELEVGLAVAALAERAGFAPIAHFSRGGAAASNWRQRLVVANYQTG